MSSSELCLPVQHPMCEPFIYTRVPCSKHKCVTSYAVLLLVLQLGAATPRLYKGETVLQGFHPAETLQRTHFRLMDAICQCFCPNLVFYHYVSVLMEELIILHSIII